MLDLGFDPHRCGFGADFATLDCSLDHSVEALIVYINHELKGLTSWGTKSHLYSTILNKKLIQYSLKVVYKALDIRGILKVVGGQSCYGEYYV